MAWWDFLSPQQAAEPPRNPEEHGALREKWEGFLSNPDTRAGLMQFGINFLQPMGVGQNLLGHAAGAVGAAGETVAARGEQRHKMASENIERRMQLQEYGLKERALELQQMGLTADEAWRAAQDENADLDRRIAATQAITGRINAVTPSAGGVGQGWTEEEIQRKRLELISDNESNVLLPAEGEEGYIDPVTRADQQLRSAGITSPTVGAGQTQTEVNSEVAKMPIPTMEELLGGGEIKTGMSNPAPQKADVPKPVTPKLAQEVATPPGVPEKTAAVTPPASPAPAGDKPSSNRAVLQLQQTGRLEVLKTMLNSPDPAAKAKAMLQLQRLKELVADPDNLEAAIRNLEGNLAPPPPVVPPPVVVPPVVPPKFDMMGNPTGY